MYTSNGNISYAPHLNLPEPSFMQDFEANEPNFPVIHAHGLTEAPVPDQKPYVYGQHRTQAEMIRESWNATHPFTPMP